MKLIDSHCHLKPFYEKGELDNILSNANKTGVFKMLTVGTHSEDWLTYKDLAVAYPEAIFYSVGLHPCYVDDNWSEQVNLITSYWSHNTKPRAVGEIGLDYFRLPKDQEKARVTRSQQLECFSIQLQTAVELDCPVIIHSRHAFDDCLSVIAESGIDWSKVIFHCFSEAPDKAKKLLDLGAKASFTGLITYEKNDFIRNSLKLFGKDNLILETDSPYLSPTPVRKNRNEPANLMFVAEKAAQILNISTDQVSAISVSNTIDLFKM